MGRSEVFSAPICPDDPHEFLKRLFHSLVARGWAMAEAEPDREPPTRPRDLATENVWEHGATLRWDESTDNVAVRGYEVYVNGEKAPWLPTLPNDLRMVTSALPRFPVSGLQPDTEYELRVRAVDYADNRSALSAPVRIRTAARQRLMELPLKINLGGPAAGDWRADKEFRDGGGYGYVLSPGAVRQETQRKRAVREITEPGDPEAAVFGWYRHGPNAYRFRVPDGRYRLTWYRRPNPWEYADRKGDKPADGYDVEEKLPEGFELRTFPAGTPSAAAFNPGDGFGRLGRAISTVVEVTDQTLVAWPMNRKVIGHSGPSHYAITLERFE